MAKLLYILVLATLLLSAGKIDITNFTTSYGIDNKANKPIKVSKTFDAKSKIIYASAVIHNIFPTTEFITIWYRLNKNNKAEILYKYNYKVSGTQFIYSAIKIPDNYTLPSGKYFVDIVYNKNSVASTSFNITNNQPKVVAKKECIKPTKADDAIFIKDLLKAYPSVKKSLSTMKLKRFSDKQNNFSLLVPMGWNKVKKVKKGTLASFYKPNDDKLVLYLIRKLPIDDKIRSVEPKMVLKLSTQILTEESVKTGAKPYKKLKIYELPDILIGNFELKRAEDGIKLLETHTLIYDKMYLYDIITMADSSRLTVAKFLSTLASYSFWTREICKGE